MATSLLYPACTIVFAQSAPAPGPGVFTASFDVATVKAIPPDGRPLKGIGVWYRPGSAEMEFTFQTLPDLLYYAYGYKSLRFDGQITGLPDWAKSQRYDILAKMTDEDAATLGKLSKDEADSRRQQMTQTLLAERFSLTLHRGTRQIPVYDLVVAKGGSKMKDAASDPSPPQLGKDDAGKPYSRVRSVKYTSIVQAYSMQSLADLLSIPTAQGGRPVVNKTGLPGTYNFAFDWSVYSPSAPEGEATSMFTALAGIGLKLQPSTAAFPTIVVDRVERPTPN